MRQSRIIQPGDGGILCSLCKRVLNDGDEAVGIFMGMADNPKELTKSDEDYIPILVTVCGDCGARDDVHERLAAS